MDLTPHYSRVALEVVDRNPRATWFHVGHGQVYGDWDRRLPREDRPAYLWVWGREGLQTTGPVSSTDSYANHGSEFKDLLDPSSVYLGRYDPVQKLISVSIPQRGQFRDLPVSLIQSLKYEFPEAKKIIRFNYT